MSDFFIKYFIIAETSVRPPVLDSKSFSFFQSVCEAIVKNYPILLKFGTNVYALYEISHVFLGVHCPKSECTGLHKKSQYIKACGDKFFKTSFDMFIVHKI